MDDFIPDDAVVVAVEPFTTLSGHPEQTYFTSGFVEDVTAELTRFPTLDVIHPASAAHLAAGGARPDGAPAVGYWLGGSVRRVGESVRIAAHLVEAATGRQLWSERYDVAAERLLDVQDEIAGRVAAALAIQVEDHRLLRARRTPLHSLDVYDCCLRGLDSLRRGTVDDDTRARVYFERALELDAGCARAHAGLSLSHFNEWSCQAWDRWDEKERLAFEHARRAADLDDYDALVRLVLGRVHVYRREFDLAEHHVARALALNPNDADVLVLAAGCLIYLGDSERALALTRKAMHLHPCHGDWYATPAALSLFLLSRYDEALGLASKVARATVDMPAYLAAASALGGRPERAASYLSLFLSAFVERVTFGRPADAGEPLRWTLHVNPFRRDEDRDHLARGLRLAGLEPDPDEARPAPSRRSVARAGRPAFRHERENHWRLDYDGLEVQLSGTKGFHDLAQLLSRPDAELHCLELAGRPADGGGDAVLDRRAREELRARIMELQEEVEDADAVHDAGRAERARVELDRIVETMSQALGFGGRSRPLGSGAERARSAVTWRIRNAIKKIGAVHQSLGRHLENAVRTGTFCVYAPERPVRWTF